MAELKPCPFCGGNNVGVWHEFWYVAERDDYAVQCYDCHFGLSIKHTEKEAIEAWNRRANDKD